MLAIYLTTRLSINLMEFMYMKAILQFLRKALTASAVATE